MTNSTGEAMSLVEACAPIIQWADDFDGDTEAFEELPVQISLADCRRVRAALAHEAASKEAGADGVRLIEGRLSLLSQIECKLRVIAEIYKGDKQTRDVLIPGVVAMRTELEEARAGQGVHTGPAPIPMVLYCPACGMQHVDATESREYTLPGFRPPAPHWDNPPHRSHLCHGCGHIWRPADVPTEGVAAIQTRGQADNPIAEPPRLGASWAPIEEDDIIGEPRAETIRLARAIAAQSPDVVWPSRSAAKEVRRIIAVLLTIIDQGALAS